MNFLKIRGLLYRLARMLMINTFAGRRRPKRFVKTTGRQMLARLVINLLRKLNK